MTGAVERFYDAFSRQFVRDYLFGNRRVEQQLAFLAGAIPPGARRVLVIGSGSGESARYIAAHVARRAEVLAVDISSENLRLARALHSHPRVRYTQADVIADAVAGSFDVIVLPDVYEHIPLASRGVLHDKLRAALAPQGRVLLTVPSPAKQADLAARGQGLQVVDEVVTVADLAALARDVQGELTYLSLISVWDANDYMHATIARGADRLAPLRRGPQPLRRLRQLARAAVRYLKLRVRLRHAAG